MFQQRPRLIVRLRRRHNGHVHALQLVDLRVINLRENQLIVQSQRVIAAPIERFRRNAAEIADSRQHDAYQSVEKFVHAIAAQSNHRADRHPFANLKCRNRLLPPRRYRLLSRDLPQFIHRRINQLGILRRFAHAHVHDDLMQSRHGHRILRVQLFHQRRGHFLLKPRPQPWPLLRRVSRSRSTRLLFRVPLLRLGLCLLLTLGFFLLVYHCLLPSLSRFRISFALRAAKTQNSPVRKQFQIPNFTKLSNSPRLARSPWLVAQGYLSSVVPHFLQTRTFLSPPTSFPTRTGPHVAHTKATFDSRIARSCSAIPPLILRCGFGRTCFFTIITCSTSTLPSSGNTRSTRCSFPRSRPVITFTVSFRRMSTRLCSLVVAVPI